MTVAEYVELVLNEYGCTDAFGIPGGVILDFIDSLARRESLITPHLNYHEQMSGFAACGYSQATGRIGVAYATRGPGICNMITCIAEAYQEGLPVVFITAHGKKTFYGTRCDANQELDIVNIVKSITKFSVSVDNCNDVRVYIKRACEIALEGKRGPVLLDINSALWKQKYLLSNECETVGREESAIINLENVVTEIREELMVSKRPVFLIGDGIRHSINKTYLYTLFESLNIPVLSSRGAQDIICGNRNYFGYIGSHGTRYSNFILAKCDYIMAIGNRMAFPMESISFRHVAENVRCTRIDIDEKEFGRCISNVSCYAADAADLLNQLYKCLIKTDAGRFDRWINTCNELKKYLNDYDCTRLVARLEYIIKNSINSKAYVVDVGNNEFWFSRAYEHAGQSGIVLYSKNFGTLGSSFGRAIGAYYALRMPIMVIIGDQGFQFNVQELTYISKCKIPLKIVVINNECSGMIYDHEKKKHMENFIHVNKQSGYYAMNISEVVKAYDILYTSDENEFVNYDNGPIVIELYQPEEEELVPYLEVGNPCQKMQPDIPNDLYNYMCDL